MLILKGKDKTPNTTAMNTYAASFGTPGVSAEVLDFCPQCRWAGRQWAKAGNTTLPKHIQIGSRDVPIVSSRHEWAKAFVEGWREVLREQGITPGRKKSRKRTRKVAVAA